MGLQTTSRRAGSPRRDTGPSERNEYLMTVINYETGEIKDSTDLVPVENVAALNTLAPEAREVAVTQMLSEARSWLAHAVEATEPQSVAHFKAFIATVAESTKQLNLSKDIQLDAQEMVRRAERGVGKAVRMGQESGSITTRADGGAKTDYMRNGKLVRAGRDQITDHKKRSPDDFMPHGAARVEMYAMTDAPDQHFEDAIAEAKAEGDLSRANVVRKVKGKTTDLTTRKQRADKAAELAEQGYSSRQIAKMIGLGEEALANIVRDFAIDVPADKAVKRTRRHDSNRIARETVNALSGLAMGIDLIDFTDLNVGDACHWAASLDDSFRALNRFRKQIKEIAQ